jgi:D-sedoheptulose 7-phosphate isomerase
MTTFDRSYIEKNIANSISVKQQLLQNEELLDKIHRAAELCVACFKSGNKVILAGNGGSAADAQHISAELVARYNFDRPGLPSIALTTDTSALTAIGNDYGYEHLFSRQLEANGVEGDVFIGITTSGNSGNILKAIEVARAKNIHVIGLAGAGGKIQTESDICLNVPSTVTPRIQECHILIGHIICGYIEDAMFAPDAPKGSGE